MLNYLQVRAVADEGLRITIEWQEELSPVNGGYYFSVPPCVLKYKAFLFEPSEVPTNFIPIPPLPEICILPPCTVSLSPGVVTPMPTFPPLKYELPLPLISIV